MTGESRPRPASGVDAFEEIRKRRDELREEARRIEEARRERPAAEEF